MPKFKVKRLTSTAQLPHRTHDTDTGWDVFADKVEQIINIGDKKTPCNILRVHTGLAIQPTDGFCLEVVPRSSVFRKGLILANSPAQIDQDYRGEIILHFYNPQDSTIEVGEKIAQLIVRWRFDAEWEEVAELDTTVRGAGGFGSTGK